MDIKLDVELQYEWLKLDELDNNYKIHCIQKQNNRYTNVKKFNKVYN